MPLFRSLSLFVVGPQQAFRLCAKGEAEDQSEGSTVAHRPLSHSSCCHCVVVIRPAGLVPVHSTSKNTYMFCPLHRGVLLPSSVSRDL